MIATARNEKKHLNKSIDKTRSSHIENNLQVS